MSEIANIVDELKRIHSADAWHGPAIMQTLEGITAEQASAKPIPNGHTIWELVLHIAAWEEVFRNRLDGMVVGDPEDGDFPEADKRDEQAWKASLLRLEKAHERLIEGTLRLTGTQLEERVAGKDYTVAFMLHGAVRHNVYHAGQIGLLKRAL